MIQITIEDGWIELASSVLNLAVKDIEKYHAQTEAKKIELQKPLNKRDYGKFVTDGNYKEAVEFLSSSYADYLLEMVMWWSQLRNQMNNTKSVQFRG